MEVVASKIILKYPWTRDCSGNWLYKSTIILTVVKSVYVLYNYLLLTGFLGKMYQLEAGEYEAKAKGG